jgi:3-dehydroquinate synthase/2-deoxy-scyllo-inosose synthase
VLAQAWNVARVTLADVSYPYYYGSDCVDRIVSSLAAAEADRYFVVTDDTVLALHGEAVLTRLRAHADVVVLSLPPGDSMKALNHLSAHLEQALAAGATRRSVVVTFGGGAPGNLGGLVAALLFRGIRLVHLPTTTVAAMDSVLSLKQAINSRYGKNHIGTYHTPAAVYVDVAFLQTLPAREIRSGLCETAKNCLAIRPGSLPALRQLLASGNVSRPAALLWLLEESLAAKAAVTAHDAREQHAGLVLEYGHTVGHAIEICDQRARGAGGISHGEAVALGLLVAARVAWALGELDEEAVRVHDEIVAALGVAPRLPAGVEISDMIDVIRMDNKRGYLPVAPDEAAMVLLRGLGVPAGPADRPLRLVPLALVERAVGDLAAGAALREVARVG